MPVPVHEDVEVYVTLIFAVTGGGEGKVSAASFGDGGAEMVVSTANVGGGSGGTAVVDDGGSATVVALSSGAGRGEGGGVLVGTVTLGAGAVVMGAREVGIWI